MSSRPIRLLHVITTLSTGGAEVNLYKLLSTIDHRRFACDVISLTNIGPIGDRIRALGVPVQSLGLRRGRPNPAGILRLAGLLRRRRPDLVQTWMHHADLIGGLATLLAGRIPVVWNVQLGSLVPEGTSRLTRLTVRACVALSSKVPRKIICNSEAGRQLHASLGYPAPRMTVIPTGFDVSTFRPDPGSRLALRRELALAPGTPLVGLVARFDPYKDHQTFVDAARRIAAARADVHFVLCGDGVTGENRELAGWVRAAGLQGRAHLLGRRDDVQRVHAAVDLACSSSLGEGFPNVIGEAMACGVPCVVTDVGDSASLVADTGRVIPPRDPRALADACLALLEDDDERLRLGCAARRRIEQQFALPVMAAKYEAVYEETVDRVRNRR
ncbi:MAG TPA: glycosyltransferase [Candidatus Acidoferrum sp.]|nr:glycosyltransferase [Candidatus Acidoferrum sp.]